MCTAYLVFLDRQPPADGATMMYCQSRRVTSARDLIDDVAEAAPRQPASARHRIMDTKRPTPLAKAWAADRTLVETVALLEAAAIALGAVDLTAESVRTARAAARELQACRSDPGTAVHWARLFHETLLDACPNRHMLEMIELESQCGRPSSQPVNVEVGELMRVAGDHEAILDLIVARAPRHELERALRRHTSESALCSLVPVGF
jgi:DNA-binding FadR family transcriptional regulator